MMALVLDREPAHRHARPSGQALDALGGLGSPAGQLRLARRRPAAVRPRMGDAAGLGRTACACRAGAGNPGSGAGRAEGDFLPAGATVPTIVSWCTSKGSLLASQGV